MKFYIWAIALYGAETWTLQRVDEKYIERMDTLKDGEGQLDWLCEK